MKRIIILALALCLSACDGYGNTTTDITKGYALPIGLLEDCAVYKLHSATVMDAIIARCPNSTTTTIQQDKARTTSVVIDGVPYSPEGK